MMEYLTEIMLKIKRMKGFRLQLRYALQPLLTPSCTSMFACLAFWSSVNRGSREKFLNIDIYSCIDFFTEC